LNSKLFVVDEVFNIVKAQDRRGEAPTERRITGVVDREVAPVRRGDRQKQHTAPLSSNPTKSKNLENPVLGPYHWSRNLLGEHLADATDLGPDTA
jgi:hypothetical protein